MLKKVLFKKLHEQAKIPQRAYDSAGFDLWPLEEGTIYPGEVCSIHLGFATEFSPGYAAVIDDRGSTGVGGITHLAGVVDADYRGEWVLIMTNTSKQIFHYTPEKAIAQVLFLKVESPKFVEADLSESERGTGKLGSSGH